MRGKTCGMLRASFSAGTTTDTEGNNIFGLPRDKLAYLMCLMSRKACESVGLFPARDRIRGAASTYQPGRAALLAASPVDVVPWSIDRTHLRSPVSVSVPRLPLMPT